MRLLFLDDDKNRHRAFAARSRGHEVTHIANPIDAIHLLRTRPFDVAFLDRDLSHVLTGEDVALRMAELPRARRPARVVVHSRNTLGGTNMVRTLRQAGYHVVRAPWRF